jgi:hypothetical protein
MFLDTVALNKFTEHYGSELRELYHIYTAYLKAKSRISYEYTYVI